MVSATVMFLLSKCLEVCLSYLGTFERFRHTSMLLKGYLNIVLKENIFQLIVRHHKLQFSHLSEGLH